MRTVQSVVSSYRGFPLIVTDRTVTVLDRRGRVRLAHVPSVKQARLFVKGYQREERHELHRIQVIDRAARPIHSGASLAAQEAPL